MVTYSRETYVSCQPHHVCVKFMTTLLNLAARAKLTQPCVKGARAVC